MDRDKHPATVSGAGLPPTATGRFTSFSPSSQQTPTSTTTSFSQDLSRMPDTPPKNTGHRRAHSEILTLPDDISFDSDLGVVGGGGDGPSFSDETEEDLFSMYIDMDKVNSETSEFQVREAGERVRVRHQHSQSMDGSTMMKSDMLVSGSEEAALGGDGKKAVSAAKLAELALVDPKRAKRIWANRQSAARSKERKMRYISELERKVHTLQTEATTLSAQLTLLQRDTNGLAADNNELKMRMQTVEQQVHLQDALNDALKEEIQHMKMLTGQASISNGGGPVMNFPTSFGANQPFYPSNNQAMNNALMTAQQFQNLQIHSQKQQQFQQHQLHQLQQQQLQHHLADFKLRPSLQSPKDNLSGPKSSSSSKD